MCELISSLSIHKQLNELMCNPIDLNILIELCQCDWLSLQSMHFHRSTFNLIHTDSLARIQSNFELKLIPFYAMSVSILHTDCRRDGKQKERKSVKSKTRSKYFIICNEKHLRSVHTVQPMKMVRCANITTKLNLRSATLQH